MVVWENPSRVLVNRLSSSMWCSCCSEQVYPKNGHWVHVLQITNIFPFEMHYFQTHLYHKHRLFFLTISCFAVRPSRRTWKARGRKSSSADICDSRYYIKSHSRKTRSCRGGGGRCFASCRFIVFLLLLNLLWSDNCLDPAFKILNYKNISTEYTESQMTHNETEKLDRIFYRVIWASFLNLLSL